VKKYVALAEENALGLREKATTFQRPEVLVVVRMEYRRQPGVAVIS
jgi:hypothetical protein